jgi:hypothetical protein
MGWEDLTPETTIDPTHCFHRFDRGLRLIECQTHPSQVAADGTCHDVRAFALAHPPRKPKEGKMKRLTILAIVLGATLVAGCTVSTEGASLSESKWVDNNCTGNGFLKNPDWCAGEFGASMGPYASN